MRLSEPQRRGRILIERRIEGPADVSSSLTFSVGGWGLVLPAALIHVQKRLWFISSRG